MIFVVYREINPDTVVPVMVVDRYAKAMYYVKVLRDKTKSKYHVRFYDANEGRWV